MPLSVTELQVSQPHPDAALLARNVKLRYTVIGVVSGLFTSAELEYYRQHRAELNRRLLELAVRRVQDQVDAVVNASVI